MSNNRYPEETVDEDEDDGTMPSNVKALEASIIGSKIVSVEKDVEVPQSIGAWRGNDTGTRITLDSGRYVYLADTNDCCAFTELREFLLHPDKVEHAIMGVGTTDGFEKWHIYADYGDILELTVGWSSGNPFYYGYGFNITVVDPDNN